jgi:hypothetical protein
VRYSFNGGGKMTDKSTRFLHRRNEDGAYDSVCRTCLAAVACSMARAELAENQKTHVCNSAFLAERGCLSRAESKRHPAAPTFQCDPRTDQGSGDTLSTGAIISPTAPVIKPAPLLPSPSHRPVNGIGDQC